MTYGCGTISILFYKRGTLLKKIFVFPICHIWFDHWNGWVGSLCFTDGIKPDVTLQDHIWCAQQLMGFQSSGPKIEMVQSKCPWNIFCCEHLCLCHQLLWPSDPLLWCSALCYCTHVICGPRQTPAHPYVPGCHQTSLPCCHFCLCCQDKPACVSQCTPHVQCKKTQGIGLLFVRVQRNYSQICCPAKGFAWISLEVMQLDFGLQLRLWCSDPSQMLSGIVSCVMQKHLQQSITCLFSQQIINYLVACTVIT